MALPSLVLLLAALFVYNAHSRTHGAGCCLKTTGSCRSACEQLFQDIGVDMETRQQRLLDIRNFCSAHMIPFWRCMNRTERKNGDELRQNWAGRSCCILAQTDICERACKTASNPSDLTSHCRRSDEISLYTCVEKKQMGEDCCGQARDSECHSACRRSLTSLTITRSQLAQVCGSNIVQCINNINRPSTISNAHRYLPCCEKSDNHECRKSCRHSLRTMSTDNEILNSVQEGGCGRISLQDPLWQCFLTDDQTKNLREMEIGLDGAKLTCCFKAASVKCKHLCLKTFSTEWQRYWKTFEKECFTSANEKLEQCIDDVEAPCELGCDGLSFCGNFNNRATDLFRSCNKESDEAASHDVRLWEHTGTVNISLLQPLNQTLYINKNVSACSPSTWKTVACTLQIKPCHQKTHANRICREDCLKMFSECLDWNNMNVYASKVCSELSPKDPNAACISLGEFQHPSGNPYQEAVTRPCKATVCSASQVCQINRSCLPNDDSCQSYYCTPGCKLGKVSELIVPDGTYVCISNPSDREDYKGCHKICHCTPQGKIAHCHTMKRMAQDFCFDGQVKRAHGDYFPTNCNTCSCYAGEIICSKKQCLDSSTSKTGGSFTTLPCNCPRHHVTVCGWNGMTYPNSCLAKCAGLPDGKIKEDSCGSKNPCESNDCPESWSCIPKRRVCLSQIANTCPQYDCVNPSKSCNYQRKEVVCDTMGEEHPNPCFLITRGRELAYHGPCIAGCRKEGEVCGTDGNTYKSECAALSRFISVDYNGPCIAVGVVDEEPKKQCSKEVKCPELIQADCLGITPPGACCPICGGAIRMLYSHKQIDRTLEALNDEPLLLKAFTIEAILQSLQRQIQVSECTIRGQLTIEMDILVLVVPVSQSASQLQLKACVNEAEKLAVLIKDGSPRIVVEMSLSVLTTAFTVHSRVASGAPSGPVLTLVPLLALVLLHRINR